MEEECTAPAIGVMLQFGAPKQRLDNPRADLSWLSITLLTSEERLLFGGLNSFVNQMFEFQALIDWDAIEVCHFEREEENYSQLLWLNGIWMLEG